MKKKLPNIKFFLFLKSKGLIWQQIESFNTFLKADLKKIIFNFKKIKFFGKSLVFFQFFSLKISSASNNKGSLCLSMCPQNCRTQDLTYSAQIFVNLNLYYGKKNFFRSDFFLCRIPIMLKSKACLLYGKNEETLFSLKECPLDPGGYFIIKGTEKVIMIQEQLSNNRITVEKDKNGNLCSVVNSQLKEKRTTNTIVLKNKRVYFRTSIFIEDVPLFILLKAFCIDKDQDIVELIGIEFEDLLEWSLYETKMTGVVTFMQAITYLSQRVTGDIINSPKKLSSYEKKIDFNLNWKKDFIIFLVKNILPHIHAKKVNQGLLIEKGVFLSLMVRRVLMAIESPNCLNDKDYYGNKRFELAGQLISLLFEDLFFKTNHELEKKYEWVLSKSNKGNFDLLSSLRSDIISNGLDHAFSTGNWTIKRYKIEKNGVSQVLSRLSFSSTLSMITKVTSQCEKIRKTTGPRSLQSSQWGMLCPSDTPEGESCGLVKNLAILAHISTKENFFFISNLCFDLGVDKGFSGDSRPHGTGENLSIVFLNGRYIGFHGDSPSFLFSLRKLRRMGMIGEYTSIFWETNSRTIFLATDSGRICRPFLVIEFGKTKIRKEYEILIEKGICSWKDLLRDGFLEFLDLNEQNNALIAWNEEVISLKTTHLELSPEIILGVSSGFIPFPDHNQSPRNTYQCAMGKQTIGALAFNQSLRDDTVLSLLSYPQKPLVKTKTLTISGSDRLPGGINTCVCIMSYSGYDIEDAIILNRSSLDRGFFRGSLIRRHKILLKDVINSVSNSRINNRSLTGKEEEILPNEPQIWGKNKNPYLKNFLDSEQFQNTVLFKLRRENKNRVIHKIIVTSNEDFEFFIKLIIRQTRKPEIGDKFSSRHGQKGVCGLISLQENLPFSNEGIIPDLIMNPHGFPSRMTIGKMIELVEGKLSSFSGKFKEAAPFKKKNFRKSLNFLKRFGYKSNGKDIFFNGISGEILSLEIFSGLVFYQKLKHMVQDKIHSRSKGGRSTLTRQPIEGRSKGGGLRFGEMERDCLVSFGASELSIERLMFSSDLFIAKFDRETGLITHENLGSKIISIKLPYACKLLFQELQSMNIVPRVRFEGFNKTSIIY
mmetsp:Transcript_7920/g.18680  ORF Transcript_7920/g.18680 Transcript_7920/m.18680 type:complete len:1104 (-) Transcript_7920:38-3349(-)